MEIYRLLLAGKHGIEIGGPSDAFADEGFLRIYNVLGRLDNCLYSARTIWAGVVEAGGHFCHHSLKRPGLQLICDATDITLVQDASYECVLASHCLEHVANPLRALREWKRVLKEDGLLLVVLPHKDGTFDWRRPTTRIDHMIEDYRNNVTESDLTHLPEVLSLHDLSRDKAAGSPEVFRERCLENHRNRAMHHHVFDTPTAVALLDRAGFQLIRVDVFRPVHIILIASKCQKEPDNSSFLMPNAEYRQRSCFHSDRLSLGA